LYNYIFDRLIFESLMRTKIFELLIPNN